MPLRHRETLNSRRAASPFNWDGDKSQNALSPVWCSSIGVTENTQGLPRKDRLWSQAESYKGYVLSVSQALIPLEPCPPQCGVYTTPVLTASTNDRRTSSSLPR
ncbi:hypothetical protein TNCV_2588041 [Trichonephila clavipes]|nr:hypothetical protein TNCV_2588041 [Trichonephila clavipes]